MRLLALLLLSSLPLCADAPAASRKSDAPKPHWQLTVSAPAGDGSKTVAATLPADGPIPSGFAQVTPSLVLRYHAGRTSAFILFDTFLGHGDLEATVTFGDQPAETQKWKISSDGRSAFVPGDPLAFIERLKAVHSLTIRIAPRPDTPLTVTFSPAEMELVMKALLSAGVKFSRREDPDGPSRLS